MYSTPRRDLNGKRPVRSVKFCLVTRIQRVNTAADGTDGFVPGPEDGGAVEKASSASSSASASVCGRRGWIGAPSGVLYARSQIVLGG